MRTLFDSCSCGALACMKPIHILHKSLKKKKNLCSDFTESIVEHLLDLINLLHSCLFKVVVRY